jgi:hypothetical protein
MANILSCEHARVGERIFVIAAARAFYVDWWVSWAEEHRPSLLRPQCELTEIAPATRRWAFALARSFVVELERALGKPLDALLEEWEAAWTPDRPRNGEYSEENAGWYAAMEAMGHGVGLFLFDIDVGRRMPSIEAWPR